ncbi:major facilitator superfamily domain-containing protein [Leptodontidium sp. 2 PMI_412]|nr:major facilitator superfamily domain-containing protein [Leptodontidium sp. 2 PMI_412]
MAFGILQSKSSVEHVPGTAQLEETDLEGTPHRYHLKMGSGSDSDVVLVPQPSSNPNDPLNWPLWQRDLVLFVYCYCTIIGVGGVGPILAPIGLTLVEEFGVDFTKISLLTGYQLCATGAIAIFISAICHKYGKRPMFIISSALLLAGTLWAGASNSYNSMLGARIIQGFGMTMFESIAFAIIGDMYFVHQRGSRMACYVLAQTGIIGVPCLAAGKIALDMGWRWIFWILSIFFGIGLLAGFLLGWGTAFNRNTLYDVDTSSQDNLQIIENLKSEATHEENTTLDEAIIQGSTQQRDSYFRRLKPWTTSYSEEPLLHLIVRPFFTLLNPSILWAVVVLAFTQIWSVTISLVTAQIFSPPPFLLNPAQLGYLQAGPMVSGLLSCLIYGTLSDKVCKVLSKRNHGIFEPEFRLVLISMAAPFTAGFFLFGHLVQEGESPVTIATVWGVGYFSTMIIVNTTASYLVDAYRNISIEVFVVSLAFKNFVFFGFSFFLNEWVSSWGPPRMFYCIGGINLGLCLSAIPIYMFGKVIRAWWHKHDLYGKLAHKL